MDRPTNETDAVNDDVNIALSEMCIVVSEIYSNKIQWIILRNSHSRSIS